MKKIILFIFIILLSILFLFPILNGSKNQKINPLEKAIHSGDISKITELVSENPNIVNTKGRLNRTPLYWASLYGNKGIVQFLLDQGADINAVDNYGYSALHNASTFGFVEIAELLIRKGAEVNLKAVPLDVFTSDKTSSRVVRIKIKGEYENWNDDPGNPLSRMPSCGTPLHNAVYKADTNMIELLISQGADINLINAHGMSALHCAASQKKIGIIKLLLSKGAGINIQDERVKQTPLNLVSERDNEEVVKVLIENGADVNVKNIYGQTPLFRAVGFYGNENIAEILISKGSEVNIQDNLGFSPLHHAVMAGQSESMELLIKKDADVKLKDNDGMTALHRLADMDKDDYRFYSKPDILKWYHTKIFDPNYAAELLLKNGAEINARDKLNHTPLFYSEKTEKKGLSSLLRTKGGTK